MSSSVSQSVEKALHGPFVITVTRREGDEIFTEVHVNDFRKGDLAEAAMDILNLINKARKS